MKALYSIIALETIAIIILSYFLFKQPAPVAPAIYYDKTYKRHMDSADNVIKTQNDKLKRFEERDTKLDTARTHNFNNEHKEHEKINRFNDTTRNTFWNEYFRAKGIYK